MISYDRAGNGWSDKVASQRTPETIATELREALNSVNIAPPYLLVGHRYGGLYVRKYHELFPDDIAGLILVDSSHPATFDEDNSSEINRLKMNLNVFKNVILKYFHG